MGKNQWEESTDVTHILNTFHCPPYHVKNSKMFHRTDVSTFRWKEETENIL
jgi:hypothetical protein